MASGYRHIVAQILHTSGQTSTWRMLDGDFWCMVTPPRHTRRRQGWKLHVSATPLSAPRVLEQAAGVLVEHGCAFKFAATPRNAAELTAVRADRSQSGKFLTAYPSDDDHLRLLAEQLHRATAGLAGPAILSDRRYRADSLVHYRYGCFSSPRELNDEGFYEGRLEAPDGTLLPDERNPWFSPPPWAVPPFPPAAPAERAGRRRGGPVLLAGRYLVREAIRHSNRGGVYRAHDRQAGEDVLLKEARPHIGADLHGRDARDWLRHEADVLHRLAPQGVTPAARDVFESGGHVFLVQDLIDGPSLQQWAVDALRQGNGRIPLPVARSLARDLTRIVGEVHAAGLVLRDLKPGNIVMRADGTPVLVDMECTAEAGSSARVAGTQGFTAPEYLEGPHEHSGGPVPVPGPEADCFSLGATLLHVTTGISPVLCPDSPGPGRPAGERIAALVTAAAPAYPALRALAPLLLGLTTDAGQRWPLSQAAAFLREEHGELPVSDGPVLRDDDADRLIDDGLAHLSDTMDPAAAYLWPRPLSLPYGDPCNVQMGAAGVLAVLDRAVRNGRHAAEPALRKAAQWLDRRLALPGRVLPGLYFGRSGAAWAWYEAARTLGDEDMADRALEYALRIPLRWHNPDLCHGLAGAGTAQLHLWRATGDERFAERTVECAESVIGLTGRTGSGVDWLAGPGHRNDLAGSALYGYGHGVAGNAAFLLAAGRALGRPDLVDVAAGGGHALCAVARWHDDGAADWPKGPGRSARMGLNFWCNGTSGVGSFLVRLWQATGERAFREHAEGAAVAVHRDRWRLPPGTCHGVAGNAELLLDLADATGEQHYRRWAAESAFCVSVRAVLRDGLLVVPDDTMRDVCASYNVGSAGVLDFLLRLRSGGGRSWFADTPVTSAGGEDNRRHRPEGKVIHGDPGPRTPGAPGDGRTDAGARDVL
ncbi:class IV lanthionine synthetase LanL [Streptomyces sp. NPDC001262]|uniref:class IV lanthionine synthetase LanL n=1 Tax=Streptomyces sp. NPDC001262 TaxID=3364552 RepID=UPI00368E4497